MDAHQFVRRWISVVLLLTSVDGASITKYDQSQHGTYNVQIHLKNLEVIAILGDSMLSGGDSANDVYDYDYTDVSAAFANSSSTSSPPPSSTSASSYTSTSKPTTTSTQTTASGIIATTTSSLSTGYPALAAASATTSSPGSKPIPNRLTTLINSKPTAKPSPGVNTKVNATAVVSSGGKPGASGTGASNKYNATNAVNVVMPSSSATATKPTQNKVTEADAHVKATTLQPATTAGTTIVTTPLDGVDYTLMDTISVPVEIQQPPSAHPTMMIRKCAPGYFRDANGKCRRVRKPHLPFLQMVHTPGVIKSFQGAESSTKKMSMKPEVAHPKIHKDEGRLVMDLANKLAKEDLTNVTIKEK